MLNPYVLAFNGVTAILVVRGLAFSENPFTLNDTVSFYSGAALATLVDGAYG